MTARRLASTAGQGRTRRARFGPGRRLFRLVAPRAGDGRPRRARFGPGRRLSRLRSASGQAAVELVALLPLVAGLALGVFTLLAAGRAAEQAAHAAEAGAVAILQDRDAAKAARAALPDADRRTVTVRVRGREVTVRVRPAGPLDELNERLIASATADAGPSPERPR